MATRNPKCNEPLLLGRQGWVTDPHRGVSGAKLTDSAARAQRRSKPLFCLGGFRCAHAGTGAGTVGRKPHGPGLRGDINVIEVGKHELPWAKVALEFYQGRVLTQCIECWHERVALFTAFCLVDRLRPTCSIMPHKPRGCRVKLPHERETGASTGHAGQTAEHCQARTGLWHLAAWRACARASVPARVERAN